MIWIIADMLEEDGSFPTYRYYKNAFDDGQINIHCSKLDEDFSFIKKDDVVIVRTRNENINERLRYYQDSIGFASTIESSITNFLTHDKEAVKSVLKKINVDFPKSISIQNIIDGNSYFVKPKYGENSFGIDKNSICRTRADVEKKNQLLLSNGYIPIIEEYIQGYDATATIFKLKNGGLSVYAIKTFADNSLAIQTDDTKSKMSFVATPITSPIIEEFSKKVFNGIGAKHILRIDFRINRGIPYVVDVNMIPGLAPNGYFCRCMEAHNIGYYDAIRMMADTAS